MHAWLRAAPVVATFPILAAATHLFARTGGTPRRVGAAAALSLWVLSLPFWLPAQEVVLRFFVALAAVLALARVWETARDASVHGAAPSAPGRFAWFFLSLADLEFSNDRVGRARVRRDGVRRLLRGMLKAVCLLLLLWLLTTLPAVGDHWTPLVVWCLFSAFCAATGAADLLTAAVMLLSGHRTIEIFRSPLLSRSPIEFWSQRWNLMFRNSAYRVIFVPVGGRRRPVLAAVLVFAFSAVIHEYLVIAALERTGGHMAAFFGLQGLATLLNQWARKRFGRRWPRALGITGTWIWMVITGRLFFTPILHIFPLSSLRLW
jgi:hypothetical protein